MSKLQSFTNLNQAPNWQILFEWSCLKGVRECHFTIVQPDLQWWVSLLKHSQNLRWKMNPTKRFIVLHAKVIFFGLQPLNVHCIACLLHLKLTENIYLKDSKRLDCKRFKVSRKQIEIAIISGISIWFFQRFRIFPKPEYKPTKLP